MQLGGLRGEVSLWEGGIFGSLMQRPEATAALGSGMESIGAGLEEVSGSRAIVSMYSKKGCTQYTRILSCSYRVTIVFYRGCSATGVDRYSMTVSIEFLVAGG